MWVAAWLICIAGQQCEEVYDITPKYFTEQKVCEDYAKQKAINMYRYLLDQKLPNQVGYRCDLDRKIKEIHGS